MLHLGDDICVDLDSAMMSRRAGFPGKKTPDGILTKHQNTIFSNIISEIENYEAPSVVDLGFMLLSASEATVNLINKGVSKIAARARTDRRNHDITLGFSDGKIGLTIHCNKRPMYDAIPALKTHCRNRKYSEKANTWFGCCIDPHSIQIKFGIKLDHEWEQSDEMDDIVKDLPRIQPSKTFTDFHPGNNKELSRKIGRNEKCPCGSGLKYKKCCLNKQDKIS